MAIPIQRSPRSGAHAPTLFPLLALGALAAAACGDEPPVLDDTAQAVAAPALSALVTGVGTTPDGDPAIRFNGQWFALRASATSPWEIGNAVSATEIAAVPVDTSESHPDCVCVAGA